MSPLSVSLIGAGSAEFAAELMVDLMCTPDLGGGTINLVDIDSERLELAHKAEDRGLFARGAVRAAALPHS